MLVLGVLPHLLAPHWTVPFLAPAAVIILEKQLKNIIVYFSVERVLQPIKLSSLFNHFPIRQLAHCREFSTAALVSQMRTLSQFRRGCTFFNTSYRF